MNHREYSRLYNCDAYYCVNKKFNKIESKAERAKGKWSGCCVEVLNCETNEEKERELNSPTKQQTMSRIK